MDLQELELRVNAHREVLISLMASMMADRRHDRVFEDLKQDAVFQDGEEDPGVIPSNAAARATHAADEIASLLDAAEARAAAL